MLEIKVVCFILYKYYGGDYVFINWGWLNLVVGIFFNWLLLRRKVWKGYNVRCLEICYVKDFVVMSDVGVWLFLFNV